MNRKHFITAALALTLCMGAGAQEQEIRVAGRKLDVPPLDAAVIRL